MTLNGDDDVAAMFAGLASLGGAESQCAGGEFGVGDDTRHDHHRSVSTKLPTSAIAVPHIYRAAGNTCGSSALVGFQCVSFALTDFRAKDDNKSIGIPRLFLSIL